MKRHINRFTKLRIIVTACILMYIIVYMILTVNGRYSNNMVTSGRLRVGGIGLRDTVIWEPCGIDLAPWRVNALGYVFFLPVVVDRAIWHRNINMFSDSEDRKGGRAKVE